MSEELKQNDMPVENPAPEETELPAAQEPVALSVAVPTAVTMWNDDKTLRKAMKAASYLSNNAFAPPLFQNSPGNCLIALEMINRTGLPALAVLQNLYIVKGKPCWSGSFCAALVNGSGLFTELDYEYVGTPGHLDWGCYAYATRRSTGKRCVSEVITMKMAADEGWLNKPGSKWKTMPKQMMTYRAAAFFARAYCPEILHGMQSYEEVQDVKGYEEAPAATVVTLDPQEAGNVG